MLFLGVLILMALIFIQPQEFIPIIKGWPLVAIVMVPLAISLFLKNIFTKDKKYFKPPQNILMVLFWIAIVISTYSVHWPKYTYSTAIEWGKNVVIYFSIVGIIASKQRLKTAITLIVLCLTVVALMGILQYFGKDITGIGLQEGRIRGVGIFDTNQLAYALSFATPFIFAQFFLLRSFASRLFYFLCLIIFYWAIYLTASRGGELCSVVVLFLIFAIFNKRKSLKILGIVFTILLFNLFLYISPRLQTVADYKTDASALGRLDAWGNGIMALKDHPLFGIGKDQFKDYFGMAAHSSYIESATELGLIGLFVWLAFFYYCIKNLVDVERLAGQSKDRQLVVISKTLQVSLYAYLIGSFFSSNSYYITLFILIGFVAILQKITKFDVFARQRFLSFRDVLNISAIEAVILSFIYLVVRTVY